MNHHKNLIDKAIMITGANSGIGKETALELAKMGARIVMVCRNKDRAEQAQNEIIEKRNSTKIDLFIADLSDQDSIRSFVKSFKEKYDKLHVLINNAGSINTNRKLTSEGYEFTFASNYLGQFLLTYLLLDLLIASAPSRIINVSSLTHKYGKIDFNDIHLEKNYGAFKAYNNSKLAIVLFTYELAHRLEGTGVTANTLHPGVVRTNFGQINESRWARFFFSFLKLAFKSAKRGARTPVYLASSPEVIDITGKYFMNRKQKRSSNSSYDRDLQLKLWNFSKDLTKISTDISLHYNEAPIVNLKHTLS